MNTCPQHCEQSIDALQVAIARHEKMLGDLDERLTEKKVKLALIEQEEKHMQENVKKIVEGQEKLVASVESLKMWQTYLMGGAGVVAVIYAVISSHWNGIVHMFGG